MTRDLMTGTRSTWLAAASCVALCAALALLLAAAPTTAQECGCATNGITPQYGVNYGTQLDGQTWHFIVGDPLVIGVGSRGGMAVWVCQPNGLTRQYYSEDAWGTNVWLNGTSLADKYQSSYHNGGTAFTAVSHTKNGDWEVVSEFALGSQATLRQVVTYTTGDYYYKRHWELTNTSGATLTDLRFMHGGDTYFGGNDSARSWWSDDQNMIYVNNSSFTVCGVMGFYGAPATPADHYYGGQYYTGNTQARTVGRLDDTANSNYVDAGYHLEWDRTSLANGETWVIEAYELWTDPTYVQVLPPADQLTLDDTTIDVNFTLHNLDTSSHGFDLAAASSQGWTCTLPGGASTTLAGLAEEQITVQVVVPSGLAAGVSSSITLTATDGVGGAEGSASTTIEVFEPDYTITPLAVDFGQVVTGESDPELLVITNNGPDVTFGTVANANGLSAPFSITDDGVSGVTLASGESCTLEVTFSPAAEATSNDDFDIPVFSPVVTSHLITVTGEGVAGDPEINLTGNSVTIPDGSTNPSTANHTQFGEVDIVASDVTITYTIENTGDGPLTLTGPSPYVLLAGHNSFSVTSPPSNTIASGGSTTFDITFDPDAVGTHSATVAISNDDSDENPYNFAIEGTGTGPLAIVSRTPAANAVGAAVDDWVRVFLNQNIDAATVDESSVIVHGSLSGDIAGSYVVQGTGIHFNAAEDFQIGETVTVMLTTAVESQFGGTSLPVDAVWQFRVAPAGGYAALTGSWSSSGLSTISREAALGDLDGDGDLDVYVARSGFSPSGVYLGDGTGSFTDSGQTLGAWNCWDVALGDLDGDGDLDAFAPVASSTDPSRVWLNNGSGVFTDSGQTLGTRMSYAVELADLNADGSLDAFVANSNNVGNYVWFNDGSGVFTDSGQALGTGNNYDCALGDVDGDDDLDAFVVNTVWSKVWLNDGTGVFTDSGQTLLIDGGMCVDLGDVDGDGDLDAFVGCFNQPNQVWLNANGTFVDSGQLLGASNGTRSVALGDFDADGDLDALAANANDESNVLWLNNGLGEFASNGLTMSDATSCDADLADLDGDGTLDVFVANTIDADRVWLNIDPIEMNVTGNWQSIASGDTIPAEVDHTDFGQTGLVGMPVTRTFTIQSTGVGALTLTDGPQYVAIGGEHAADFEVTESPDEVVLGGYSSPFEITFDPSDIGLRTATVSIANDDADENPYTFAIQGTGGAPPVIDSPATAVATEDIYFHYQATVDDPDGPDTTFVFDQLPAWLSAAADSVYGTPEEGDGNTSFVIVASDGQLSDTLVVDVTVVAVNDPPVITSPDAVEATEDAFFSYQATAYDPDSGGAPLSLPITFTFDQMPAWLSAAADSVYGTPLDGAEDTSFRIIASDGDLADTLVVAVTVLPVNDPPVITSTAFATAVEDEHFVYEAAAVDPDGPSLTFSFDDLPEWLSVHPTGMSVHGTPGAGLRQTSFEVSVTDGYASDSLTVRIELAGSNDPPVITSPETADAIEDESFVYECTAADPEDDDLVFFVDQLPEWLSVDDSTVHGIPPEGATQAAFRITVSDGSLRDTMDVAVTVTAVNDPPVITSADGAYVTEDLYFSYQATVTDPDGPILNVGFEGLPDWLTANADVVFGTPGEGEASGSFDVIACDGMACDTLTVWLTMIAVNDAPEIASPAMATATEDVPFTYVATATDPDLRGLTFSFENLPMWLTADGDRVSGTPLEGETDTSFRVVVTDGSLSDSLTVELRVVPVNDAPVITSSSMVVGTEDVPLVYQAEAVDVDGPSVSFTFTGLPDWLTAGVSAVTGTPLEGMATANFVVVATDGELADTLSVSVRINPQNDAPVITSLDAVEATGYEYFRYLATATDVDGPGLAFSFEGLPAWMDAASDSVYGVPDSDATDTFFTVVASDGSLADTLVVTLRVTQLLDAPALHLSGPNPFKGQTTIQYELPAETDVRLTIYDVRGREVVTLVDGKCPAGYHELMWDATNAQGRRVATGVYFARITTADYGKSVKMMVLR